MGMEIKRKAIAIAVGVLLLAPFVAQADADKDARFQALEDRMRSLEDRLVTSEATVQAQRELLAAQPTPDVAQGSGLDSFLSGLEWGGHITGSYIYSFNNPDRNLNSQEHFQFNVDHNSFQLDAVKLELGKPVGEPGTAGFQLDLLFGENASLLSKGLPANQGRGRGALDQFLAFVDADAVLDSGRESSLESFFLQEAYVTYNHDGIELKFGQFETLLGYEVIDSPYNPHITHSELFFGSIPLFHTGLLASGELGEDMNWAVGVVNGFNNSNDFNENKGILGRIGWTGETTSLTFNTFIGSEGLRASGAAACAAAFLPDGSAFSGLAGFDRCFGDNNNRTEIYDLVATMMPAPNIDIWAEVVYGQQELDSDLKTTPTSGGALGLFGDEDPEWLAVVLGLVYDMDDKTKVALRAEYFEDDGNFRLGHGALGSSSEHYSATVTLARQVTQNLMARIEYRHDVVDGHEGTSDKVFQASGDLDDQQDIGILEVSYTFD